MLTIFPKRFILDAWQGFWICLCLWIFLANFSRRENDLTKDWITSILWKRHGIYSYCLQWDQHSQKKSYTVWDERLMYSEPKRFIPLVHFYSSSYFLCSLIMNTVHSSHYFGGKIKCCLNLFTFDWFIISWLYFLFNNTAQKIKFSIKDFFSKCDQIRSFLIYLWFKLFLNSGIVEIPN